MIIEMKRAIFISTLSFSFILCFFGYFEKTTSQGLGVSEIINVQMVPEVPKAGDSVYVYLTSYATNIDTSTITWKVNGKTIKTGIGEKIFNFTMGVEGQTTTLDITVKTTESGTIQKNFKIRPASVDLMWESHGFVPPFYKGKALFAHQNKVTIIAFPHILGSNGIELNPKNLVYKWKRNGSVIETASGFGKNSITLEGSIISRPVTVTVEVSSDSGEAYGSVVINPVEPYLVMYKKDPTYGIQFQKVLDKSLILNGINEITVVGVPFFFDREAHASKSLVNSWFINGNPLGNEKSQWIQTFRPTDGTRGSSNISLNVENVDKILQSSSNTFSLIFNNENN